MINRAGLGDNGLVAPLGDYASVDLSKLSIGYFADDEVTKASPTGRRAVKEAADTLRAAGANVSSVRRRRLIRHNSSTTP